MIFSSAEAVGVGLVDEVEAGVVDGAKVEVEVGVALGVGVGLTFGS